MYASLIKIIAIFLILKLINKKWKLLISRVKARHNSIKSNRDCVNNH